MPPIKVLRIISRLNVGGPTIHVTLLTKLLAQPDYECWLITGHIGKGDGDMNYYPVQQGVTPIYMDELGKAIRPMKDIVALWKLWRMMRRLKPDVVHTHTMKAGFLGRLAAWLAGVPVILFTAHGYGLEKYFTPLQTRIYHTLDRLVARISTRVIALTPSIRRELLEVHQLKDTDKVIVIKLGLDLERFVRQPRHQGEFRAAWNISTDAPLFAIVGRIVPIKNHTLFLQAAANGQTKKKSPEV